MSRSLLAALVCAAFVAASPLSVAFAQSTDKAADTAGEKTTKSKKSKSAKSDSDKGEAKAEKKLSPQQMKMKECGAKWQEEKKAKGVKGREAYRKFLSTCLKKS